MGKIFPRRSALHKTIGQERKGGKAYEKAVNEIHETWLQPVSVTAANKRLGAQSNRARPPGIERVKTRKVYYISMPNVALFVPIKLGLCLAAGLNRAQQPVIASTVCSHE